MNMMNTETKKKKTKGICVSAVHRKQSLICGRSRSIVNERNTFPSPGKSPGWQNGTCRKKDSLKCVEKGHRGSVMCFDSLLRLWIKKI